MDLTTAQTVAGAKSFSSNVTAPSVTSPMYVSSPQALTSGATITWNPANGLNASVTLNQNSTLSFSSTPTAGTYGTLIVTQDATGGRTLTLPATANKILGSASTTTIGLSSGANARDILNFYYDGTNCYWNVGQGYGVAATTPATSLTSGVSGTLPVANGGTGVATITGYIKGNGTSAMTSSSSIPVADVNGAAPILSPNFTGTPTSPTAAAGTNTTQVATTEFVTNAISAATIPDATTSAKGKIQLAGDLGGTAAAPTVPGLASKANSSDLVAGLATKEDTANKSAITTLGTSDLLFPTQNAVKTYVDAQVASATIVDATTSAKGKIQLAGDLGGTAAAPTVPGLALKAPIASPTFTGTVNSPVYASAPQTLTDAATIIWNPSNGLNASVTLGGNRTLSFSSTPAVGTYGTLVVTQDATGNRTITLPSTSNKVLGSTSTTTISLSSAANAKDILNFYYDGTNCYWNIGQGYGTAATTALTNLASGVSGTLPVVNGGTGVATLTGIVKANGTGAMSAATAGTDYLAPNGSAAGLTNFPTLNQNTTGNASNVTGTVAIANGGTGATSKAAAFDALSPMTTAGDMIYGGTSGTGTRLAKGSDGQVLTLASGIPSWSSPSAGITGSGTVNSIPKFSTSTALSNSSISEDGTGLYIGKPTGGGGVYTGLNGDNNTRLFVNGGRELESIKMSFPGDPYNNELSFNWYSSAWKLRTERSSGDITDLSFWRTAGGTTTEQMRLTAGGNLGIGINPSQKLDVAGNVKFSGALMPNNLAGTSGQVLTSTGANTVPTWTTPAGVTSLGAIGSLPNANGASISGNTLSLQPADASNGGVVTTGTQTFAGAKTFNTDLTVNGLTVGRGLGAISSNTAVGGGTLLLNTTGARNTALGFSSLLLNTDGSDNTALGWGSNNANKLGSKNTSVGSGTLFYNTSDSNSGVGFAALYLNTSGTINSAFGGYSLNNNATGNYNSAFGGSSLSNNTSGNNNTAIGKYAMLSNTVGNYNTIIGADADVNSNNLNNATAIGYGSRVYTSNTIQLGADGTSFVISGVTYPTTPISNVKTSGTLTLGTVTYPNAHNSSAGQVLTTNAAGVASWATPSTTASAYSGTLPVTNGGTGLNTTPANGQIDIGNGTGFTRATLTAGTAITITNTAGAITIAAAVRPTTDQFTASAAQTTFTLSQTPLNAKVWMFINGVRTNNNAYTISGTTITYTSANNNNYTIVIGDRVQFDYAY